MMADSVDLGAGRKEYTMSEMKSDTVELLCGKGDVIFKEGESGSCMYKLLEGGAAVYANYGEPESKLLTELNPGDYFGEMAVIEISPRSATVVATKDCTRLKVIDAGSLSEYLKENESEIDAITRHLSWRLRELTWDYIEVCDTLRELGRLDTSSDRISDGLFERVKKFAAFYLKRRTVKGSTPEISDTADEKSLEEKDALFLETYQKGDVIFRERDHSDCMYGIHSGRVGIFTGYGTEKQKLLTELSPNMFFGEMGMFEKLHRSASAVAMENGTIVEPIHEGDLEALYEKNPAKVLLILQHLSSRLRRLTKDYLQACRTLTEAEESIELANRHLTDETRAKLEYINQLLLMPEIIY